MQKMISNHSHDQIPTSRYSGKLPISSHQTEPLYIQCRTRSLVHVPSPYPSLEYMISLWWPPWEWVPSQTRAIRASDLRVMEPLDLSLHRTYSLWGVLLQSRGTTIPTRAMERGVRYYYVPPHPKILQKDTRAVLSQRVRPLESIPTIWQRAVCIWSRVWGVRDRQGSACLWVEKEMQRLSCELLEISCQWRYW